MPALWTVCRLVRREFRRGTLDEYLREFEGWVKNPGDARFRARVWEKAGLGRIRPEDVHGMPAGEMALMMKVAMEIEDPIRDYSRQNGEGFRVLLPALARFMGQNREEALHADEHGLPWCGSPWCAEERRHAHAFARMIERLTGCAPLRDNPNRPRAAPATREEALRHLISREAAEWNSSSTYLVMAAHASGDLHVLIRNIARDEVKHLCILSAADRHLLGQRPWRRFADLVRHGLAEYRGQKRKRSGGEHMGRNKVVALEVVVAHLMSEYYMRGWLRRRASGASRWE